MCGNYTAVSIVSIAGGNKHATCIFRHFQELFFFHFIAITTLSGSYCSHFIAEQTKVQKG